MLGDSKRVLAIGAHPDDCDIKVGGVANKYASAGHDVKFLSLTNGSAGHHRLSGSELVERRRRETRKSAAVAGIDYEVYDNEDGELQPTLDNRRELIREIREYDPDLVLAPRPNDYHPDHRYTSRLVQDSAYMVTVPNICPDVEPLSTDPVIAYVQDGFEKPYPFDPAVVVDIDDVVDDKLEMLHQHTSQFYEWLPYNRGNLDEVPDDEGARKEWLATEWLTESKQVADDYRELLVERYGEERGHEVDYAEAFEPCEYGSPLTAEDEEVLFPF
ncbi:PIG-L deacetylase family protein [Haloarchaeobius sp. DFWS5]|uniref:PIG-L deacetylase family protein n=1 Tax=Haloarchaeobius sp. DFWS5 TaxID=3446114 RepID=UPI003EBE730E